jgi:hypothetical protein
MEHLRSGNIWIISKGTYIDLDLGRFCEGGQPTTVTEYKLSELGRYLLNPNPIQVEKKLIGCEVHYRPPYLKDKIRKLLPPQLRGIIKIPLTPPDVLISNYVTTRAPMQDKELETYLNHILDQLKPYDPVIKFLLNLDPNKIADVIGTCRDLGGNQSYLNVQGSIDQKIGYISKFMYKNVGVIIKKAYISDGLFEMKGFDFESYDSSSSYRLIKFMINGKPNAVVLSGDNTVEYWVEDLKLLHYLQLFDQLIKMNPKLNKSLRQCTSGKAEPMKLFFNQDLGIDYSAANLPEVYRRVFEMHDIAPTKKDVVKRVLNHSQLGVTFNYVPQSGISDDKLFVNFSVMHDFKALEPLRNDLPQVYSEISKRSSITEAGRFYLLDSFRGYKDDF